MGIAWERRADRTRDYVAAMRRLWGDEVSAFNGEFARFANVRSFPKPVAGERLPVVVGGNTLPALRRVAEYGNGWFGLNLSPEATAEKLSQLGELMAAKNRSLRSWRSLLARPATNPPPTTSGNSMISESANWCCRRLGRGEAEMIKRLEEIAPLGRARSGRGITGCRWVDDRRPPPGLAPRLRLALQGRRLVSLQSNGLTTHLAGRVARRGLPK